jgi:hypothetical protein
MQAQRYPQHPAARDTLRLTLAVSLLVLAQAASAADEISIIPGQRQLTVDKPGIITLRFGVENRSGQAQQLQENLILPTGWELVTNTAPFALANGSRDVRLVHVTAPRGTTAGTYNVQYIVSAQGNGSMGSSQTVAIQIEEQAGLGLTAIAPPSSLLGGEHYAVEFLLENTGNHAVTYKLAADDDEGYINTVSPRRLTLGAGESGTVIVNGEIPRSIDETSSYRLSLSANGGGKSVQESVTIPLISRTPKGISQYQKLPGKIATRYTTQQHKNTDGSTTSTALSQVEYAAQGAIDAEGDHRIEVRLRNGQNGNDSGSLTNQQTEYQGSYWNDEVRINAGHQSFQTSNLSGNSLSGVGAEVIYTPQSADDKKPLELRAFDGKSRSTDTQQETVAGGAVRYQWDEFDTSASVIQHKKQATATAPATQQTIAAVGGAWQGEHLGARTEIAADDDASAWSVDINGQWGKVGANASILNADPKFDGSNTNTRQTFANAHYQVADKTSVDASTRQTQQNLAEDQSSEIRQDQEHQARITQQFGDNGQIEVSLGHSQRQERDIRPTPTTDRDIQATTVEYRQRFDDINIRAAVEQGTRTDRLKSSGDGTKQELAVNWQATQKLNLNTDYSVSNDLDSDGKRIAAGINANLKLTKRANVSGYLQRSKNDSEKTHANSLEVKYTHDLKKRGNVSLSTRRTDNQASDGKPSQDNSLQLEYSVPLDMPIRKRNNVGAVRGAVKFADTQRPASDVVVQMGGQYAVTDEKGQFNYPGVIAKEYQVQVDSSRANTQGYMLSEGGAEARVAVQPNKTVQPQLALYPAAKVSGKLQTYINDAAAAVFDTSGTEISLQPDKGIGRVLLELQPIGEVGRRIVHKRTTLHDGSFSFVGIPPGQWRLVVVDNDKVPANFRLEQTEFTVDLNADSNQNIQIRAIPTTQGIKKTGPSNGFDVSG